MSAEHKIPEAEIEQRAREVCGEALKRVDFRARRNRSERITIHLKNGSLTFTHESRADPDAVRRAVLVFFEDARAVANETVKKLLSEGGEDG